MRIAVPIRVTPSPANHGGRVQVEVGRLDAEVVLSAERESSSDLAMTVQTPSSKVAKPIGADERTRVVVTAVEPGSGTTRVAMSVMRDGGRRYVFFRGL